MEVRKTKTGQRRNKASGFSLIEMTMVVALIIIVSTISVMSLMPALQAQHLTNAYNTTLGVMRQARDNAVSQKTTYSLTFTVVASGGALVSKVTMAPTTTFSSDLPSTTYQLPTDVAFATLLGLNSYPPPDGFGSASQPIDFGYTTSGNSGGATAYTIYFCPDGSAQTTSTCGGPSNWDNGVVYLNGPVTYSGSSATGYLQNMRAITLWGGTGRIRGWRFYPNGAYTSYQWVRQ